MNMRSNWIEKQLSKKPQLFRAFEKYTCIAMMKSVFGGGEQLDNRGCICMYLVL